MPVPSGKYGRFEYGGLPVSGGDRGHGGVVIHSGPQGNSTATCVRSGIVSSPGALAVSSGASSSGTLVPDKGRLKGRRSGGFPRSSDAHWSDGQRRRRSAAEHSTPSIISWPTYPPKSITVWGYAECLVPQRLIRGQYVLTVFMGPELLFLSLGCQRPWNVGYGFDSSAVGWRIRRARARPLRR